MLTLKCKKGVTSFDSLRDGALLALGHTESSGLKKKHSRQIADLLNHEKNHVKHGHGKFQSDIRKATSDTLTRAIDNFDTLSEIYELEESELIRVHRDYCDGIEFIDDEDE